MTPIACSSYQIRLLSDPLLTANGERIRLSPFQSALLMLVYAEGEIGRSRIAELLWAADGSDPRARHRIRQLKSQIRRRAGAQLLVAEGDVLCRAPEASTDLDRIEGYISRRRLAQAARFVAGRSGVSPACGVTDAFIQWGEGLCSSLSSQILTVARAQWETTNRHGDWERAADAAEALYTLNHQAPDHVARVIEARGRMGHPQESEVAYARFEALGVESSIVDEAIARIRRLPASSSGCSRDPGPSFVGRQEQLTELTSAFDDVRSGTFTFNLVVGEAGVGKSRLLREVERSARIEGFRCLTAEPVEAECRISLNPILDALTDVDLGPHLRAIGDPWRTVIGTMLPPGPFAESVQALPPVEEQALSRRLLDAFALLFRSLADEQPTIFFLDDLHWADATTIAALQFLQRRWKESCFGIIATARLGALRRTDPAHAYLSDSGQFVVRRINLEELSGDEARRLVEVLGQDRVGPSDVTKLCALSGRHPLYLTELTRDYLSGRLTLPAAEADAFSIPVSLRQILTSRMEGAGEVCVSLLNVLAVGSKPMRLGDLADILELGLDATADGAAQLAIRQLVELERDRVSIAHDLFRSAIYRDLSEAHRALLHDRLAEQLRRSRGIEAASELATHYDRAGRPDRSATYGSKAAEHAFERGAVAEAAHFYELVTRNARDDRKVAEATAMLATSLHLNRDMSRANPALELAATRLRSAGMAARARRMDIRRVEGLAEVGCTPVDELVARLSAIKEACRTTSDWEGVALALDTEVQLLQLAEKLDAVLALADEFQLVINRGAREAVAIAHQGLAVVLLLSNPQAALRSARSAVALARNRGPNQRLKALNRLLIVLLQQGALHSNENSILVREAETLSKGSGDLLQRFSIASNVGVSFMDAGLLDMAEAHFERAEALLGNADMTFPRINLAINRGELSIARNQYEKASQYFASAGEHGGLAIPKYTTRMVTAGLGICALQMGRMAEARRLYEALPETPSTWYYDPTPLLLFQSLYLERRGDAPTAIATLEVAQSNLQGRLVAAWIKTQLSLVRLLRKVGDPRAKNEAWRGLQETRRLSMVTREREFQLLLEA